MDAPNQNSRWLGRCVNILWLVFESGRFLGSHGFAIHTETLQPALGFAVIVQAVGLLLFFASAMWTGKLCRKPFLCWQVIYILSCAGYSWYHLPSMEWLFLGTMWPANIATNIWMTLLYRKETQMTKNARMAIVYSSTGLYRTAKRQDCVGDLEKAGWKSSFSMTEKHASARDWSFAYGMLFNFSAGAFALFSAYLTGTLNAALTTFGLGFTVMLIVAFVLLGTWSTSEADRLADHFRLANVISIAVSLTVAIVGRWRNELYNFGWMCFAHWAAYLYSGIAVVLVQTSLDEDTGEEEEHDSEEENDSEDSDEGWLRRELGGCRRWFGAALFLLLVGLIWLLFLVLTRVLIF